VCVCVYACVSACVRKEAKKWEGRRKTADSEEGKRYKKLLFIYLSDSGRLCLSRDRSRATEG
jgi:hypothetical protein